MISFEACTRIIEFFMLLLIILQWFKIRQLSSYLDTFGIVLSTLLNGMDIDIEEIADKAANKFMDKYNKEVQRRSEQNVK